VSGSVRNFIPLLLGSELLELASVRRDTSLGLSAALLNLFELILNRHLLRHELLDQLLELVVRRLEARQSLFLFSELLLSGVESLGHLLGIFVQNLAQSLGLLKLLRQPAMALLR